jgi:uncharacterized protein (DUF433 family)
MDWQERIVVNPEVLVGKPVIKGTRIAVEFLMELLANGWTHEQILHSYPINVNCALGGWDQQRMQFMCRE